MRTVRCIVIRVNGNTTTTQAVVCNFTRVARIVYRAQPVISCSDYRNRIVPVHAIITHRRTLQACRLTNNVYDVDVRFIKYVQEDCKKYCLQKIRDLSRRIGNKVKGEEATRNSFGWRLLLIG